MLRREFGSATEGRFFAVFFPDSAWTPSTRRTPPFANALVATHHSLIVCRFPAGSGAGDRGAGPAAGGPRPNPELGIEKAGPAAGGPRLCPVSEDRRAGAAAGDMTKAGSGAGETRNRSGSRWPAAGSEAVLRNRGAEVAAGGLRLDLRRWRIERPEPADSIAPSCRRQLTAPGAGLGATEPCAGDWERSAESSAVPMTRLHPGLTKGRSQAGVGRSKALCLCRT